MINQVSVCVNALDKRAHALHAAAKFAVRHNSALTAVYSKLDTVEIVRWAGSSPLDLTDELLVDQDRREETAKSEFDKISKEYDCDTRWLTVFQSQDPIRQMMCTDMIFIDQPNDTLATYPGDETFLNHLILQSKRPVVMIPTGWEGDAIGDTVLLGWNSSAEAMRATADALPIMGHSEKVIVLDILKDKLFSEEQNNTPAVEAYLVSKGINTEVVIEHAPHHNEEITMLQSYANENNVDLIVIGGYGHTRLRELVMGGMTSHLIKNSTIPVLFSH